MTHFRTLTLLAATGLLIFSSCSSVSSFKLGTSESKNTFAPIDEKEVVILYRQDPPKGVDEFAVVNYQTGNVAIEDWYKNIRKEAAKNGAHYVYKVKASSTLVQQCATSCNANGACSTSCSNVPSFAISGTMGRKK